MEGRIKTASVEIEASSSMWTKISETTMACARDLSLVRQAVARFVQAPTVEKVMELDTATATASQSASFLSFAIQHGCQASSEAEHALDALFNATHGHEANMNRTMDVLGSRLQSMIEVQRNVENEILSTTFSIEAELPKKLRGEILPELWNVGNATGKKNEGRTRSLLSALRNVTLSKYYANTLSERIVGVVRTTMGERSVQKKNYLSATKRLCDLLMGMYTSLSIHAHLAHDGNATAMELLASSSTPEESDYLTRVDFWKDETAAEERAMILRLYGEGDVDGAEGKKGAEGGVFRGTATVLRLAMESERVSSSVERRVMLRVRADMEEDANKATTELLHQAVLRSHTSEQKLKEWTPESTEAKVLGNNVTTGEAMMSDLLHLAEEDLRKGHLRRADDYHEGKLVVEESGARGGVGGGGESEGGEEEEEGEDELTTEEKEAVEDTQRKEVEEKEEERSMEIDRTKVKAARTKTARNDDEEEERSEEIVKSQENEMSTLEKKLDDKKAIAANHDEYTLLKTLDRQRGMVEKVASAALEREGAASMSWSDLRANRTGSNRTMAMLDQLELESSIDRVKTEMKRTNDIEEDLSDARGKVLETEVAKIQLEREEEGHRVSSSTGEEEKEKGEKEEAEEEATKETTKETTKGDLLTMAHEAKTEQDVVQSLIQERSRAAIDAEEGAIAMARNRAAEASVSEKDGVRLSLVDALVVAKAEYASALTILVGEHKEVAHTLLHDLTNRRKEKFRRKHLNYQVKEPMSVEVRDLLSNKEAMKIGKTKMQRFFKRPFTNEEVAKEMSGEDQQHV